MRILLLGMSLLFTVLTEGQNPDDIYLYFDQNDSEFCIIPESQQGRYHGKKKVKKYKKNEGLRSENKVNQFYICNELFLVNKNNKIKKRQADYLQEIEFSQIDNLIEVVNRENPLYPFKVYPLIYLVEKVSEQEVLIYEVKWQYYTE